MSHDIKNILLSFLAGAAWGFIGLELGIPYGVVLVVTILIGAFIGAVS